MKKHYLIKNINLSSFHVINPHMHFVIRTWESNVGSNNYKLNRVQYLCFTKLYLN